MKRILDPLARDGVWWLTLIDFYGAEEDKNSDEENKDSEDDEDDEEKEKGKGEENNEALLKALRNERRSRRALEKEIKGFRKSQEDAEAKDQSETEKAKKEAESERVKALRLAQKLRSQAIDNVVLKLATNLKFRDMDDALKLLDRDDIEVEQDEADPSDITVDEKTIKTALEELAKKKPHLILADGDTDPSGSKFGGSKTGPKKDEDAEREKLIARYPALRLGVPRKS